MDEKDIALIILIPSITFIIICSGLVFLIYTYYKTKQKFLQERIATQLTFSKELNKTKQEIQDQTLTYIGRELHDNIGQLLTISKIHSNSLIKNESENKKLLALDDVLNKVIVEIKQLSKSLDSSRIADFGFHKELATEVSRINSTQVVKVDLQIEGDENIENEKAIILYRILQEFISNSVKYSSCDMIEISLTYMNDHLQVRATDNGIGFDFESVKKGSGLNNIKNRISLLQAENVVFESNNTTGTILSFSIPASTII